MACKAALLCAGLAFPHFSDAATPRPSASPPQEITVTLFGQPCQLAGPLDKTTLKEIHAISPEQVYPAEVSGLNIEPVRKSLEKLKAAHGAPPALDRYRERLLRRLELQVAFLEGLAAAKRAKKAEPLLAGIATFTQGKRTKQFNALLKKTNFANFADREAGTELLDALLEAVEPDPEEDFHKAIQRLSVQYTCVFADEVQTTGIEEPDEGESAPATTTPTKIQ